MKNWIYILLLGLLASCAKEDDLTPSVVKNWYVINPTENMDEVDQKIYDLYTKYNLAVFYKDDVAQAVEPITVSVTNAPLREVLQTVVGAKGCTFAFEGNTVVIRKQAPRPVVEEVNLRGRVTDTQGMPLPGVTVLVKEMSIGTATDTDGRYQLTVPMLSDTTFTLAFSFVGFETVSVEYAGQDSINVVLRESVQEMDEVVVTGYQTLRKSDVVGSVATVKAEDILMPAYSSVDQMLQGRVAGMMVMNTSSRVGTTPKIRIRGTSTLLGNQDPLWVVDGVIQPDPISLDASDMMVDDLKNILGNQISWLNPADIETITVLKDASATAIYGSKAANGVIVITTKKGDTGRLTVNYSNNFAFRARPHYGLFNMMNSQERIEFSREAFDAGAVYSSVPVASTDTYEGIMSMYNDKTISREEAETAINRLKGMNTNWLDILTRNSFSQSHNLSLSGGTDKVSANASIGFSNEAGVEVGNNARGLSGRLFVSAQLADNLQVDVNLSGSIDKTYGYAAGVNPMNYALNTSRAVPAYNEDGSLCFLEKRTSYELNSSSVLLGYNVLNEMEHSYSKNKSVNLNGSLNLAWNILPWLRYEFVGGIQNVNRIAESYAGEQTYYIASRYRGYDYGTEEYGSQLYNAAMLPRGGELYNQTSDISSWNISNRLLVQTTFKDDHRINFLLGTEVTSTTTKDNATTTFGYVKERGEIIMEPTSITDLVPIGNAPVPSSGVFSKLYTGGGWSRISSTSNQFSVFATLAYVYKDRYVLNASMRNDASNRFGQDQNKRFDPTYSFGLSWNAALEPWMESISNIVNQLNFRMSFGIQGNTVNSISPELILSMGSDKRPYNTDISLISRLPNPDLSWERTKTWNFGLDLQLLRWITMNVEYYTKRSNNIVTQRIALEYGRPNMEVNGGRIENSGIEYTLNVTPLNTDDWGLTLGLNSGKNWNKARVESIETITLEQYLTGSSDRVLKKGYDLSSFWSFSFKGLNPETGYPEFNKIYEQDANGNYVLGEGGERVLLETEDAIDYLVYSGKSEPDFSGGLTLRLRYKSVILGTNFSLLLGSKKRLPSPYPNADKLPLSDVNLSKDLLDRWQQPGDEEFTDIPAVYTGRIANEVQLPDGSSRTMYSMWDYSDARVVDASFLRCQQLSLTWNMNENWCKKIGIKRLSVNAIMNNLFVIANKKFDGFDPELGNSIMPKTYSFGVNIGF